MQYHLLKVKMKGVKMDPCGTPYIIRKCVKNLSSYENISLHHLRNCAFESIRFAFAEMIIMSIGWQTAVPLTGTVDVGQGKM